MFLFLGGAEGELEGCWTCCAGKSVNYEIIYFGSKKKQRRKFGQIMHQIRNRPQNERVKKGGEEEEAAWKI